MSMPIRVRMTAWYAGLLALIIAAVGAFLVLSLRTDLVASMDRALSPAVDQIAQGYHAEGVLEARDVSSTVLAGEVAAAQVLTPTGRIVVRYGNRVGRTPMIAPADIRRVLAGERLRRTMTAAGAPARFRIVARATTRRGRPRVVVAGESMALTDRSAHRLLILLLIAGPAALAATAAGGWWLARRALRPVHRLTTEADQIGIDRLADRLPVPATGDEVAHLAQTLNTMLARIQSGVEEQHRLIADASHELRTPLAAMRAELDISLRADDLDAPARAVLHSTREEVDRLSRTVEDLLTLARTDHGSLDLRLAPIDLATVAAETTERLRSLASSRGVRLETDLAQARASGDATRLGEAIGNLIDNAITFTPHGGTVRIATAATDGQVLISVLDEGPGIPPAARERVFDRFYRLDASRTRATGGSGIGLSIVREIARAHRGRAWTEPGPHGGSLFALAIPCRADAVGVAAASGGLQT